MAPRSTTRCAKNYIDLMMVGRQLNPLRLPVGAGGGQGGSAGTLRPKDSHKRRDRATQKAQERYDRQTNKQASKMFSSQRTTAATRY